MRTPILLMLLAIAINFCAGAAEPKPSAPPVDPEIKRHYAVALAASAVLSKNLQSGAPVQQAASEEEDKKRTEWRPGDNEWRPGPSFIATRAVSRPWSSESQARWHYDDEGIFNDKGIVNISKRAAQVAGPAVVDELSDRMIGLWHTKGTNRAIRLTRKNYLHVLEWADQPVSKLESDVGLPAGAKPGPVLAMHVPGYGWNELFCATNADASQLLTYDHSRSRNAIIMYDIAKVSSGAVDIIRRSARYDGIHGTFLPICFMPDGASWVGIDLDAAVLHCIDPKTGGTKRHEICLKDEYIQQVRFVYEDLGRQAHVTTSMGRIISLGVHQAKEIFAKSKE